MKKSLILALVAVVFACTARAMDVTTNMAMTAANAWAARNVAFGAGGVAQSVRTVRDTNTAETVLWHQVKMSGGGCLIVAPVTEIEPVLAALEEDPGELPAAHPLRALLTADMRSRLRFLKLYVEDAPSSGGGASLLSASPAAENADAVRLEWAAEQKSKWRKLGVSSGGFQLMEAESVGVPDPIDVKIRVVDGFDKGQYLTHWNQSNAGGGLCFNYWTPNNAVCGCVATACSAVLQFFKTAAGPEGYEHKCTYNGVSTNCTTIGGPYDWSILPSNWGGEAEAASSLSEEQRELLGRVAYDAGVCLGMMWTDGESGAYTADIAAVLRDNFGFQHAALVSNPKLEQYHKLIYMQCWAGAPVVMGIKGHAVVACGYGKDAEGVPRARVFMGWGGSGDAWYALPQIDTQSVLGGSTYLSEVISCVITMIGYQDDKVIPVCGQIIPSVDATVECCGETGEANDKGYFGLRISAATPAGEVVPVSVAAGSAEKSGSVMLGTAATPTSNKTYAYNAAALCDWIPDDILIMLLKSETASTFAEAKEKALASLETENPKAILAFSGTWGTNFAVSCELATTAAWDYLYSIDYDNIDDFTNKYVVLCTPYSLSGTSASDGNPSFAVFEPRAITTAPDKLWSFFNGRLSYWTIGSSICTTNDEQVASATNNVVVGGALTTYVTGEDITNAFISVLDSGRTAFLQGVSGITLSVEGSGGELGAVEPAYGLHNNTISNGATMVVVPPDGTGVDTNGVTIVAMAPAYVTNDAQNIEFRCAGWLLSSTNSTEVWTNSTDVIPLVPNGAYTLTWLWETNAVKITTEVLDKSSYGTIEPGTGWFPYGEDITFTATGNTNSLRKVYSLNGWKQGSNNTLGDNDEYVELGNVLVFRAMRPVTIQAEFRQASGSVTVMKFNLKVVNYGTDDPNVPDTLLNGVEPLYEAVNRVVIPYDTEKELVKVPLSVQLATNAFEDAEGEVQVCLGWMLSNEDGILDFVRFEYGELVGNDEHPKTLENYESGLIPLSMVGFNPSSYGLADGATATLTWLWAIPPEEDVTNVFDIVWNDDLTNLSPGYTTNLISEVALGSRGWTLDDLTVNAPTGWVAEVSLSGGNVVATLSRDDTALEAAMASCALTVSPNDDDTLTVEATIANGLRGFWYVLYGSDDLTTWEPVADGTYESGTPAAQGQGTAEEPISEVKLSINVTPGDSAAGPKRFYKVVSGATSEPLTE